MGMLCCESIVSDSPVASFATTVEDALRTAHRSKIADWTAVSKYVRYLAHARDLTRRSDDERGSVELLTDYDHQSREYGKLMLSLRTAMEKIEDASIAIPEKCVEAVELSSYVRAKLAIMEDRFRLSCVAYIRAALHSQMAERGQFENVDEGLARLTQYFESAPEVKAAQEEIELRKKAILEADQRRREEYERKRKEEAERVQKLAAQCEAKWIAPYTGMCRSPLPVL
jgi:hypothetical protein